MGDSTGHGPTVTLVVAAAENGVIGRDGELPWRLPSDLARFKRLTMGRPLIMGRKTYESIGRPLPGRVSIVLTRQSDWDAGDDRVFIAGDLEGALRVAAGAPGVDGSVAMVVGGEQVYRLALPIARRVELTRVHTTVAGDARFPDLPSGEWRLAESIQREADDRNEHAVTDETWVRQNDAEAA